MAATKTVISPEPLARLWSRLTAPPTLLRLAQAFLLAWLAFQVAVRVRDGGNELVTEPYLVNQGWHMYTEIANHHAPLLTYLMAAVYRVAGYSNVVKLAVMAAVAVVTGLAVLRLAERWHGRLAGLLALGVFVALWPAYGGREFWFDSFLGVWYVLAFVALTGRGRPAPLAAGLLLGVAVLFKQHAVLVAGVLAAGLLLGLAGGEAARPARVRAALLFGAGAALPLALWLAWAAVDGRLADTWYWLVTFNLAGNFRETAAQVPIKEEWLKFLLWAGPGAGLVGLHLWHSALTGAARRREVWLLAAAGAAAATLFPRYHDWHWAPAIPLLAVALGAAMAWVAGRAGPQPGRLLLACLLFAGLGNLLDWQLGFRNVWQEVTTTSPVRRFASPPCLVDYIGAHTTPDDRIYILGFNYEGLYYDTQRLPAGTYYLALPWFTADRGFRPTVQGMLAERRPAVFVLWQRVEPWVYALAREHLLQAGYTLAAPGPGCERFEVWQRP